MKTQIAPLIAGLSLAVALPVFAQSVFAQSADAKYCDDLKERLEQYISDGNEKGSVATSVDVEIAKGKCHSDPAKAIPLDSPDSHSIVLTHTEQQNTLP